MTIVSILVPTLVSISDCKAKTLEKEYLTPDQALLIQHIDTSLASAFLTAAQSPDGAWRSETYGMFRGGMTLTPFVMSTLFFIEGTEARASFRKGVGYLMSKVDEKGAVQPGAHGFLFPVLTAASASRMVCYVNYFLLYRKL